MLDRDDGIDGTMNSLNNRIRYRQIGKALLI